MAEALLPTSVEAAQAEEGERPAARALRRLLRRRGAVFGLAGLRTELPVEDCRLCDADVRDFRHFSERSQRGS